MTLELQLAQQEQELERLRQELNNRKVRRKFLKQDKEHALQVLLKLSNGSCLLTGNRIVSPDGVKLDGCEFHHIDGDRSRNHWSNLFPCHRDGHNRITHNRLTEADQAEISRFQRELRQYKMLLSGFSEEDVVDSAGTMDLFEVPQDSNVVPFIKRDGVTYYGSTDEDGIFEGLDLEVKTLFDQAHRERMEPLIKLPKHKVCHVYEGANGEKKRCYRVTTGEIYPGCTTILEATKPLNEREALARWRAREGEDRANQITNRAASRGTWTHSMIEAYCKCEPYPELVEGYLGYWESMQSFLSKISSPLLIENAVWHPSGYAGTLDWLGFVDGELSLVDWKTSDKPKKEEYITGYKLQGGGYRQAINWLYEEYNIFVDKLVIVVAIPGRPAQEFPFSGDELDSLQHGFNKRLKQYQEMMG